MADLCFPPSNNVKSIKSSTDSNIKVTSSDLFSKTKKKSNQMASSGSDDGAFVPLSRTSTMEKKQNAMEMFEKDPEMLFELFKQDPRKLEKMKDYLETHEREVQAAEIMKIDEEEITDQIEGVKKDMKELIANTLLKIIDGNTTRRFYYQDRDNRDMALAKFEEMNDFESSFRLLFVEPFNEVMSTFAKDFHNEFTGVYLSGDVNDDDDDDDDDYEIADHKRQRKEITPNKGRRGLKARTSMSPKLFFEDGQRVMVKVDATGKFEERVIGNVNHNGYITKKNAEKKYKEGKLRA